MKTLALVNGRVIMSHQILENATVIVEDGRISEVRDEAYRPTGVTLLDVGGSTVAPGFIDIHVHGSAGHDTMDATPQALSGMAEFFAAHGVTSFLPTTVAAGHSALLAAIENVAKYSYQGGACILGVHLEGPYLSGCHPGAQPLQHIRPADPSEYAQLFAHDNVLLISLAPEISGNMALVEFAREKGAKVAVGHSAATYEEVMAGVKFGLSQACHTFNGMAGLHHRQPGTVGAVLACDEIYAQIIVDFVHLHPAIVKILVRAKGIERTVLITDAIRATGLPDGTFDLGGQSVTVSQGAASLTHGNSLAGSVLTMDKALRNVMEATGLSLAEALPMATSIPAHSLGLGHELGSILPGYSADLVILDSHLNVQTTLVQGEVAYQSAALPESKKR